MRVSLITARIARHLLALLMAGALGFLCVVVCSPIAIALPAYCFSIMAFGAGVGWMVGGLSANRKRSGSALLIFAEGAALASWFLQPMVGDGSAMLGLFEFQSAILGATVATWFMLRGDGKARRQVVSFALATLVLLPVVALQFRVPGRLGEFIRADGESEFVVFAQPLTGEWRETHAWRQISRSRDATYIWRADGAAETGKLCGNVRIEGVGPCYTLTRLTKPAEIDAAYAALWATEEWLIDWEISQRELPFFMRPLAALHGEWRHGSVWRAEE